MNTKLKNHNKPNNFSKQINEIEEHRASKNTMNTTSNFEILLFSSLICERILFEGVFKDLRFCRNWMWLYEILEI
jgi:hypothetical protein